jgi:hypothetical protein
MLQVIADGAHRASRPWTDTYTVEVSTTDDLFHTLKTMWGPDTLRSVTDSTEQFVWCLLHMRSMLHVISVICYLTHICICTSYYCEIGDSKYRWSWIMITYHIHTNVSLGRMTY